jgi:hypothetical protein
MTGGETSMILFLEKDLICYWLLDPAMTDLRMGERSKKWKISLARRWQTFRNFTENDWKGGEAQEMLRQSMSSKYSS